MLGVNVSLRHINNILYSVKQTGYNQVNNITVYCILRGRIKGFNSSITTIMCEDSSYIELWLGSYRTLE